MMNANWNFPTTIWFGAGRIKEIATACNQLNISKPLFVTDEGLVKLKIVADTLEILKEKGLNFSLFSEVQGNPTENNVMSGVTQFKSNKNDGVIAFGGGSAIDAAKAIAFMAGQNGSLWDFEDIEDNWTKADIDAIAPVIAIPTTAGTGSEVGRASVISDTKRHVKKIIFHPRMLPELVIEDPELTMGLPAHITAWTGVDALVHAIEAFCAPGFHPMADGIAVEAIRMISIYLPIAYKDGYNLEARSQMLIAASMGATAFRKGLGSVHSVAHQLGALYNQQHGLLNAIILPYALRQNSSAIREKMIYLSKLLELKENGVEAVIKYICELRKELGIPHTLNEIGINDKNAEEIGQLAHRDPSTSTNAISLKAKDLENLFRAAVSGDFKLLS